MRAGRRYTHILIIIVSISWYILQILVDNLLNEKVSWKTK